MVFKKLQIWFKEVVLFSKEVFKNDGFLSQSNCFVLAEIGPLFHSHDKDCEEKQSERSESRKLINYIHCPHMEEDPSFVTFWLSDSMGKL